MKRVVISIIVIGLAGAAAVLYSRSGAGEPSIDALPITRGDIVEAIGSTGTLQAVTTVQVGSQVSGNVAWLGADFNSIVRRGQEIARIDPSTFEAQVEQASANLARAQAEREQRQVALLDADIKYSRAKALAERRLLAQSDLDAATAAVDAARAQIHSAEAGVAQAQASLDQSRLNVKYCVITAPIDGIVIQRSVDIGQTVAATLQSPTLFVLAADLTKMQVKASIDEADVGRIRPGQRVTFRVDAFPAEEFEGTVSQVRLQPVVVQNVTTYETIIDVPNRELKLKPGMTASVRVQAARSPEVLRVPNVALRFRPTDEIFVALGQAPPSEPPMLPFRSRTGADHLGADSSDVTTAAPVPPWAPVPPVGRTSGPAAGRPIAFVSNSGPREARADAASTAARRRATTRSAPVTIDQLFGPLPPTQSVGRVWVLAGNQLRPLRVRLGISDGAYTELLEPAELSEGATVVTGVHLAGGTARTAAGRGGAPSGGSRGGGPLQGRGGLGGRGF